MYEVIVRVVLLGRDGMMGLSRVVQVPFPPFRGLELLGLSSHPASTELVVAVTWSPSERRFYADLEDYEEPRCGIAELIDHFGAGWELNEPGEVCEEAS
jgi:hypothetical protein